MRRLSLMTILEKVESSIAEENKKGKMVALFIPQMIGESLQNLFQDVPGEMVSPEDMHITLGFPRTSEDEDRKILAVLKDLASQLNPLDVEINEFGTFPPNEHNHNKHVLWAKPSGESIFHLHDTIYDLFKKHGLKIDNGHFDFNPHVTIKYCDEEPDISKRIDDPVFRIKNVSFASDGKNFHAPFKER